MVGPTRAGIELHELTDGGGLLLVAPNNVDPGQQHIRGSDVADGSAPWLARFTAGSKTPEYNRTFPRQALEVFFTVGSLPAAPLGGVFAVTANTQADHGRRGTVSAVMLCGGTGTTLWNITLDAYQTSYMSLKSWSIVGAPGSQLLLQVTRGNGTAFDLQTGKAEWSSDTLSFSSSSTDLKQAGAAESLLALVDGSDGNSNTLTAVSLKDGKDIWQFPTVTQLQQMGPGTEAFIWETQCSDGGVCFLASIGRRTQRTTTDTTFSLTLSSSAKVPSGV